MTSILENITSLIAPHSCFVCSNENNLLCKRCAAGIARRFKQNCFMCGLASADYAPCQACVPKSPLLRLYVLGTYTPPLSQLVVQLKYQGARQFARDAAEALAVITGPLSALTHISHIPTSPKRIRLRSYDQAALLARAYASRTGVTHQSTFVRNGNDHQVGASRAQRLQQAQVMLTLNPTAKLQGARLVIADDVYTTGASMLQCARLALAAGAESVTGIVIARQAIDA